MTDTAAGKEERQPMLHWTHTYQFRTRQGGHGEEDTTKSYESDISKRYLIIKLWSGEGHTLGEEGQSGGRMMGTGRKEKLVGGWMWEILFMTTLRNVHFFVIAIAFVWLDSRLPFAVCDNIKKKIHNKLKQSCISADYEIRMMEQVYLSNWNLMKLTKNLYSLQKCFSSSLVTYQKVKMWIIHSHLVKFGSQQC